MRTTTIVRLAMVAIIVGVLLAVTLMWQDDRPEDEVAPEDTVSTDVERGVVSRTLEPRYVAEVNGVRRYEVRAGRAVRYEGNRQEFDRGVELLLYGEPEGEEGAQDVTRVEAERLEMVEREVPIAGDQYESVLLRDGVKALLPNGAVFDSDVLVYGDGALTTEEGVVLRHGGIVVESRTLSYDHETRVAELRDEHPATLRPSQRGPVKLWSAPTIDNPRPLSIQGSTHSLVYEVETSRLRLDSGPQVVLPQARVRAVEIALGLDPVTNAISAIDARGDAEALWTPAEGGAGQGATGEHIGVTLAGGEPQGLVVRTEEEDGPRPAFELSEGTLRADVIEVSFVEATGASQGAPTPCRPRDSGPDAVSARGQAYFFPADDTAGLGHIAAGSLAVGAGGQEELLAEGGVEIELGVRSETRTLTGPCARVVYRDGAIVTARWPRGLEYRARSPRATVTGGYGALEAASGDWILQASDPAAADAEGGARPRFSSREVDVDADHVRLMADGNVELTGAVSAALRGETIRTVGPLFGDAAEVLAAAERLLVRGGGERFDFAGNARVFQQGGDQLLRADEIVLRPAANELQGRGNVIVSLLDRAEPGPGAEAGAAGERTVVLTGRGLLLEGDPLRLTVAGEALLDLAQRQRTIGGDRLTVEMAADGAWQSLEVHGNVVMTDPAGRGEGASLHYDVASEAIVIGAAPGGEATFVNGRGFDIRDREGLQLEWVGDSVEITAMQNGTTQIVRRNQR